MNKEISHTQESFNLAGLVVHSTKEQVLKRIEWIIERKNFLEQKHKEIGARLQANSQLRAEEMERLDEETRNAVRTNWEKALRKSERATAKQEYKKY